MQSHFPVTGTPILHMLDVMPRKDQSKFLQQTRNNYSQKQSLNTVLQKPRSLSLLSSSYEAGVEPKKQMGQRIVNSFQQSISLTSKKITEKHCYTGQVGQY